jgi:hypothetical protein
MSTIEYEHVLLHGNYAAILINKKRASTNKMEKENVIVCVINNITHSFTNRRSKLEQFYKYYHHLAIDNNSIIYVISTNPSMTCKEIIGIEYFMEYIYKIPFKYLRKSHTQIDVENLAKKLQEIKKNTDLPIFLHIFDDFMDSLDNEEIKTMCGQINFFNNDFTTNIDYDTPNIFMSSNSQTLFEIDDKINEFNLIFDNNEIFYSGILNGSTTILIGEYYDKEKIFTHKCDSDLKLLNLIYSTYLIYYGKNNNKDVIYNFIVPFFEKQFEYFATVTIEPHMLTVINVIKEWVYYLKTIEETNIEEIDNFLSKMTIGHISHKKYIRVTNNFYSDMRYIEFRKNINEIIDTVIEKISDLDDDDTSDSLDMFYSMHSMTNWVDEIEEKSCIGVVINITVPNHCRSGKKIEDVKINHTTSTFMSVSDYISTLCSHENKTFTGDLNNTKVVDDPILGSGNFVIPLFINKYHWKISQCYLPIVMGLGIANNVKLYTESMDLVYYSVLSAMTQKIFAKEQTNSSSIQIWITILRTCMEISVQKRFHKGFDKHISNMLNIKNYKEYSIVFGQMLSVAYVINDRFFDVVEMVLENMIKKTVHSKNNTAILATMLEDSDVMIDDEICRIIKILEVEDFKEKMLFTCFGLTVIEDLKKEYGGVTKLIFTLDKKCGILNEKKINKISQSSIIKTEDNINKNLSDIFKKYNKDDLFSFKYLKQKILEAIKKT